MEPSLCSEDFACPYFFLASCTSDDSKGSADGLDLLDPTELAHSGPASRSANCSSMLPPRGSHLPVGYRGTCNCPVCVLSCHLVIHSFSPHHQSSSFWQHSTPFVQHKWHPDTVAHCRSWWGGVALTPGKQVDAIHGQEMADGNSTSELVIHIYDGLTEEVQDLAQPQQLPLCMPHANKDQLKFNVCMQVKCFSKLWTNTYSAK